MIDIKPCPGCGHNEVLAWCCEEGMILQCDSVTCGWQVFTPTEMLKGIPEQEYYDQSDGTFSLDTPGLQPAKDRWNARAKQGGGMWPPNRIAVKVATAAYIEISESTGTVDSRVWARKVLANFFAMINFFDPNYEGSDHD